MSFLDTLEPSTRPKVSLPPGIYGSNKEPGLKIVAYLQEYSNLDKNSAMQHKFVVAATKPSREAADKFKSKNGSTNPLDQTDFEGTAFMTMTLHEDWLNYEASSLAFTYAATNKEGVVSTDHIAQAIASGDTDQESVDRARAHFMQIATDKCIEARTPAEQLEESVAIQYGKELKQINIKVRTFVDLQAWKGVNPISLQFDPSQLVGTEFAGKVETREYTKKTGEAGSSTEVVSVYSPAKKK